VHPTRSQGRDNAVKVVFVCGEVDSGGTHVAWIIHFITAAGETDMFLIVHLQRFEGNNNASRGKWRGGC
jgi:hypothetical protein